MRMTCLWPDAVYARVNDGEAYAPVEIADKSICVSDDIGRVPGQLA